MSFPEAEPAVAPKAKAVKLSCNLRFAALVAVLFPVLVGLGFWQLWRSGEKAVVLQLLDARRTEAPVPLAALSPEDPATLERRHVTLRGHYVRGRDFLLDNRIFHGSVGYELISPFRDDSGVLVMVNRGWLAAMRTRDELPAIDAPDGQLQLSGEVHVPVDRRTLPLQATGSWPCVVQAAEPLAMGEMAGLDAFPYLVRLHPGQPGVTEADWPAVNIQPERHVAYATQWFMMAASLAIVFVVGGTNAAEWFRHRHHRGDKDAHTG